MKNTKNNSHVTYWDYLASKEQFIIQDWASNTLQHTGKFNFGCYGKVLGVPRTFESWDEAEAYLSEFLGGNYELDRSEYYIEEIEAMPKKVMTPNTDFKSDTVKNGCIIKF
ncbi:hypothetical protein EBZ39_17605 [bacterium]|nr:hypothetical protein [bacterium]